MGRIEEWFVEGCRTNLGGPAELTLLLEAGAPVNLRYQAFLGALPNITGIQFRKLMFAFRIVEPLVLGTCLYRGAVGLLLSFPPAEGGEGFRFTPERFVTPNAVPRVSPAPCPEIVELSGAGRLTPPQTAILVN